MAIIGFEAWGDGSGGAKVLTTDYVLGPALPFAAVSKTLVLTAELEGVQIGKLHIQVVPSPDGGKTLRGQLPNIDSIRLGETTYGAGEHVKALPAVSPVKHTFPIDVVSGMTYKIQVKRSGGGDATSKALVIGDWA